MLAHSSGDPAAFAELFRRYAPLLERVLLSQPLVRSEVEDLIQQTFLQVHRARRDFDATQSFRPWLFTIAFNLRRVYFRRRKRRPEAVLDEEAPELARASADHARSENLHTLDRALANLSTEQREVIALHWFGGLNFSEVANALGASTAAVKVRAHRGYLSLRRFLEDDGPRSENRARTVLPTPGEGAPASPRGRHGLR